MPLSIGGVGRLDLSTAAPSDILKARPQIKVSHLEAVAREFELASQFDLAQLRRDLQVLRNKIEAQGKPAIFVQPFDNLTVLDRQKYRDNKATNELVREVFAGCRLVGYASMNECVSSKEMEVNLNHFQRDAYMRLASLLQQTALALLEGTSGNPTSDRAPSPSHPASLKNGRAGPLPLPPRAGEESSRYRISAAGLS
jgi:hypothetical protein